MPGDLATIIVVTNFAMAALAVLVSAAISNAISGARFSIRTISLDMLAGLGLICAVSALLLVLPAALVGSGLTAWDFPALAAVAVGVRRVIWRQQTRCGN